MNIDFTVFKEGQPLKTISVELPVVIGRGSDSTLTIKHPLLSRRHCEIYEEAGQVYIKDLASLNGTFVDDARVETVSPLSSGSQLKLGIVAMQVSFEGGDVAGVDEADFEMGAVEGAPTDSIPVVTDELAADAESEPAMLDLGDFEVSEPAEAGEDAGFDLAEFEVVENVDAGAAEPESGPAVAEAESLDLGDFEVAVPGEAAGEPEAQIELPSFMDLAGGLDEVSDAEAPAPAAETEEPAAPAADDPWAALPAEPQVSADDDDLDAFLADLG